MDFGSSLIVPSVQELVKESVVNVPSRYVRLDQHDQTLNKIASPTEIPVVDFQKLISTGSELANLHSACRDWGFFQVNIHFIYLLYQVTINQ